jgi:hypothetical protein
MGTKDTHGDPGGRTSEEPGNLTLDNFESFGLANSTACGNGFIRSGITGRRGAIAMETRCYLSTLPTPPPAS